MGFTRFRCTTDFHADRNTRFKNPPTKSPLMRREAFMNCFARRDCGSLRLRLNHRTDNTLQVGNQRFSVLGDIELHGVLLILFRTILRHEIEGVVATCGEQDGGAYLTVVSVLGQSIGKMNELVNELEKFWRVGHGRLSLG